MQEVLIQGLRYVEQHRYTMLADSTACQQHLAPVKQHQHFKPCRVSGCTSDLSLQKSYCQKKAVCSEHLKADAVKLSGCGEQLFRFCQQCGKLQPLAEFRGKKRSCLASLERRKKQPGLLLSTRMSTRCSKRQQVLQQQQQQHKTPRFMVQPPQPAAPLSRAQHGSCASLQQLSWSASAAQAAGITGAVSSMLLPGSTSCSANLAGLAPCVPAFTRGSSAPAYWEPSAVAAFAPAPAAAAEAAAVSAPDGCCTAVSLASAVSGSESTFTAAAAASLAEAWWQSEQQQLMGLSGAAYAPSSSAGTGATCAAAASSYDNDESALDSLLVEAINQSLAGNNIHSAGNGIATPSSFTATPSSSAAPAPAAAAELAASDKELEEMIMQELAAAGIALTATGGLVLQPPAVLPLQRNASQQGQQQQQVVTDNQQQQQQQQMLSMQCIGAAFSQWAGIGMPPAAAASAGVATAGSGSAGGVGAAMVALQQQTMEVERMLFELKQLRDAPADLRHPAASGAAMHRSDICNNSIMAGSLVTGATGWHGCF